MFRASTFVDAFVKSFDLLELFSLNLSRFFTVQLSMFIFAIASRQLVKFITIIFDCQELFFIFLCYRFSLDLRQLCKSIIIIPDCQELFYFCFSQLFQSQATLTSYHNRFCLSTTFFIFLKFFVLELSNSMRFSKQLR